MFNFHSSLAPLSGLFRSGLVLILLMLCACSPGEFTLNTYNATEQPIHVSVGEEVIGTVPAGKGQNLQIPRVADRSVVVKQQGKVLEQFTVGQAPLDIQGKESLLYIAGGPLSLALGDFTDFYGETPEKPAITDVVNLRQSKFHKLQDNALLWYPSPKFPRELVQGKRMIRMVSVPPKVPDDKIKEYMYYELKFLK